MPLRIDWEGLIVGFESRSQQITHFFDRETGDVEQALVRDAARHAEFEGDPRFVALPRDQGERTRGDLEAFLSRCEDDACRSALTEALSASAAAGAFRSVLLRYPNEEARFFQFKEHQALDRAQAWLSEQGVDFRKPDRGLAM
ncbi:MAG: UPF0158 family protein [Acidobacteriota bacterium]